MTRNPKRSPAPWLRRGVCRTLLSLLPIIAVGAVGSIRAQAAARDDLAAGYGVEECIAVALANSARVEEAEAKVAEFRARMEEIRANYYPKLSATAFLAPMFTVQLDDIGAKENTVRWQSARDWGPFVGLDATLFQPVFTFGRVEAGEEAARERMEVERARLREVRNAVALEIRRMYYFHLYARSMLPSLEHAAGLLVDAEREAEELYQTGSGDVTQVDLAKLRWGAAEIAKFRVRAGIGARVALQALKQLMGWPETRPLVLKEVRLPTSLPDELPDLAAAMGEAARNRPEWAQLEHGRRATLAWANAELLANAPVVALAATLRARWAPTVEDTGNYYHNDAFNDFFGGVAVALQWDLDPWRASARRDVAVATQDQLVALHRFAATGIPMQVRKAHADLEQMRELFELSHAGAKSTKRWLTFAAAAFASGTGEPRDILEGLAAYLQAKNGEYEALRDYYLAQADFDYAVGRAGR